MSIGQDEEELSTGEYVYFSDYKMMCLKKIIAGTVSPTEEEFSAALTRLINHLEKFPLPEIKNGN
jgi:hypothetical protein